MASSKPFRVVIVGGGVGGLALANMLEKFDIDYVLLERHGEIAPAVGASIALMPSGLLIMDQLGCYEDIRATTNGDEMCRAYNRDHNGQARSYIPDFLDQLEKR